MSHKEEGPSRDYLHYHVFAPREQRNIHYAVFVKKIIVLEIMAIAFRTGTRFSKAPETFRAPESRVLLIGIIDREVNTPETSVYFKKMCIKHL